MKTEYREIYESAINDKSVILVSQSGSRLLGTHTMFSDEDFIGVFIEPMEHIIGFQSNDTRIVRTAAIRECKVDAPSLEGDVDITLYGLRKYLQLAMNGNPNVTSLLYAVGTQLPLCTSVGNSLQELRGAIVSKKTVKAMKGLINNELAKANNEGEGLRKQLASAYAMSCCLSYLINKGLIQYPLTEEDRLTAKYIRNGDITAGNAEDKVYRNLRFADNPEYLAGLQDEPDRARVERWMVSTYIKAWDKTLNPGVVVEKPVL